MTGYLRLLWTERRTVGGGLLLAGGLLLLVGALIGRLQLAFEMNQISDPAVNPVGVEAPNPLNAIHQMNFLDWGNRREAGLRKSMPIPGGDPGQFGPEEGPWPSDPELLDRVEDFLDHARLTLNQSSWQPRPDDQTWPGGMFSQRLMYGLANRALHGEQPKIALQRMDQLLKAHLPVHHLGDLFQILRLLEIRDQTLQHLLGDSNRVPWSWTSYTTLHREWLIQALDGERTITAAWTRKTGTGLPQSQLKALPPVFRAAYSWLAGPGWRSRQMADLRRFRDALGVDQPLENLLENLPEEFQFMDGLAKQLTKRRESDQKLAPRKEIGG